VKENEICKIGLFRIQNSEVDILIRTLTYFIAAIIVKWMFFQIIIALKGISQSDIIQFDDVNEIYNANESVPYTEKDDVKLNITHFFLFFS
jgi:hypothetical protein